MSEENSHIAYQVSIQSMVMNFILCVFKGICGFLIASSSLISDAVHSLTDIFSTLIVLIGIKLSSKPADETHPYGHEKIECIIAFLLGIMLLLIGGLIGWGGLQKLWHPMSRGIGGSLLNTMAILSAVASISAKEWMYRFTIKCAHKINSSSMAADAWHHRTDALSSIGSLIGVIGIRLGYPIVDAIACFIISIFILKAAFDICIDACQKMIDTTCSPTTKEMIENIVLRNPEVLRIDALKVRQYGSKIYVDLEITLNKDLSFVQAHGIAQLLHDEIEKTVTSVKHCMIHTNPSCLLEHHHI